MPTCAAQKKEKNAQRDLGFEKIISPFVENCDVDKKTGTYAWSLLHSNVDILACAEQQFGLMTSLLLS